MSRLPRAFLPEIAFHVTLRGNDRQDIVQTDADRRRLLHDLKLDAKGNGMLIHAYVLMTNHLHLLVSGSSPDAIPRTIQGMGRRYVRYYNLRHERTGTLWEGRYKASPVASERYLMICHRYIELNPIRAGMVLHPADYVWSSHRRYALGYLDELLTEHPCWLELGGSEAERRAAHRALIGESVPESDLETIRLASSRGFAIGDEVSCRALESRLGRRITPIGRGRNKFGRQSAACNGAAPSFDKVV